VAGADPSLPAARDREVGDLADQQAAGLVEEVEVEVHVAVELSGEVEDETEVRAAVGVVVGHAADRRAAHRQGLAHQRFGPGRLEDPFLGEDADLQIDRPRVLALEREDRLHASKPDDGIDLDAGAHRGRVPSAMWPAPTIASVVESGRTIHLADTAAAAPVRMTVW